MRILLAEYVIGFTARKGTSLLIEGKAMLEALKKSFEKIGNEVVYPFGENDFERAVEKFSKESDAALVIAPDEMLAELTKIVESNTVNLGCPSHSVEICADKLRTTEILHENGIAVPRIIKKSDVIEDRKYVKKPRYGCASENVFVMKNFFSLKKKEPFIITDFIPGEDISSSIVVSFSSISSSILPLTINKQFIRRDGCRLRYEGGLVPYSVNKEAKDEIISISKKVAEILHCEGYVGIDFVLGRDGNGMSTPYVVDVNPRATTSIVGIAKVLNYEIAELILRAKHGMLPEEEEVKSEGEFVFYF